jgi:hypothetical protein
MGTVRTHCRLHLAKITAINQQRGIWPCLINQGALQGVRIGFLLGFEILRLRIFLNYLQLLLHQHCHRKPVEVTVARHCYGFLQLYAHFSLSILSSASRVSWGVSRGLASPKPPLARAKPRGVSVPLTQIDTHDDSNTGDGRWTSRVFGDGAD